MAVKKENSPTFKQNLSQTTPTAQQAPSILTEAEAYTNHWHSYMVKPVDLEYESQLDGEKILLFLRQHPIVNVSWIFLTTVMFLAPFVLTPFFPPFQLLPLNYQFILFLFWTLFIFGFVVEHILMYLFNSFIVTNQRIIDIDFYSLIYKTVSYAQLEKIEDVDTQVGGVLFSLIDAGNMEVQTAAEVPQFEIDLIPHPAKVAKLINELMMKSGHNIQRKE